MRLVSRLLLAGALPLAFPSETRAGLPCDNANLFHVSSIPADSGATQLLSTDLDSDGRADLVVIRGGRASFEVLLHGGAAAYESAGRYTWSAPIVRATLFDLNTDGRADLAFTDDSSRVVIFRGEPEGVFVWQRNVVLSAPGFDLVAKQLNGTGGAEVVVSHPTAAKITSLMAVAGVFQYSQVVTSTAAYVTDPYWLALGRLNTDALDDLLISRRTQTRVWLYRGAATNGVSNGAFIASTSFLLSGVPSAMALEDVDLDGRLDALFGTANGLQWTYGQGDASFSGSGSASAPGAGVTAILVTELNRDVHRDLLFTQPGLGRVGQVLSSAARTYARGPDYPIGAAPVSLAAADLGGGREVDFMVAARASDSLFQLIGHCEFSEPPDFELPVEPVRNLDPPVPGPDPVPAIGFSPPPSPPDPGPSPVVAPWPLDGIVVCDAAGQQSGFTGVDDYAHGAYFAWVDERNGESDIFVTRIGPDGQPVAGWTPNGTPVCTAAGSQSSVTCFTDGTWGLWVLWLDQREPGRAVYIQKLLPDGQVAPGWPVNGRRFCASPSLISYSAESDRRGGMQISWIEVPSTARELYAHHLDPDALPALGWPECGVLGFREQQFSDFCSQVDRRLQHTSFVWPQGTRFTYEHSVHCTGGFNCHGCYNSWSTGIGVIIPGTGAASNLPEFEAISPGSGPTIQDYCEYLSTHDDGGGGYYTFDGCYQMFRWGAFGNPSWMIDFSFAPDPVPDGNNGFDVVRYTDSRMHVSKVLNDGTWSPSFGSDGVPVCEPPCLPEFYPARAADGSGGAMIVWRDTRNTTGSSDVRNLYATWIRGDGTRGPGWRPEGDPIATTPADEEISVIFGNRRGAAIVGWRDQRNGDWDLYAYRLTSSPPTANPKQGAHVAPAIAAREGAWRLSLAGARPNPSSQDLRAEFTLSRAGDATLRLLDVSGRVAVTRELRGLGPGLHAIALDAGDALPPGIYLLELAAEGTRLHRKLVVTR